MTRCSLLIAVALGAALLGACQKKKQTENSPRASTSSGDSTGGRAGSVPAKVDWAKVERVPYAKLQTLLPASLPGYKRTDLGGGTSPNDEYTDSHANAEYQGANGASMQLTITDNPARAVDQLVISTTAYKGHPVIEERESSDGSVLELVVGERFFVRADGEKVRGAQVKSAIDAINLATLASWKNEGIKK